MTARLIIRLHLFVAFFLVFFPFLSCVILLSFFIVFSCFSHDDFCRFFPAFSWLFLWSYPPFLVVFLLFAWFFANYPPFPQLLPLFPNIHYCMLWILSPFLVVFSCFFPLFLVFIPTLFPFLVCLKKFNFGISHANIGTHYIKAHVTWQTMQYIYRKFM